MDDKEIRDQIERLAQAIDRAAGLAAAAAGYVASLPGADKVDVGGAKTLAQEIAPSPKTSAAKEAWNPALRAEANVSRIADLAKKAKRQ